MDKISGLDRGLNQLAKRVAHRRFRQHCRDVSEQHRTTRSRFEMHGSTTQLLLRPESWGGARTSSSLRVQAYPLDSGRLSRNLERGRGLALVRVARPCSIAESIAVTSLNSILAAVLKCMASSKTSHITSLSLNRTLSPR